MPSAGTGAGHIAGWRSGKRVGLISRRTRVRSPPPLLRQVGSSRLAFYFAGRLDSFAFRMKRPSPTFAVLVAFLLAGGVNVLRDAVLLPLALLGVHVAIFPAAGTYHP